MPEPADRPVRVVDLRTGSPGRDAPLGASRDELADLAHDDRLLVVADTTELVALHPWFVRAASAVRSVLVVAVGAVERPGGGVELRQSSAVAPPWGTLWVGGERTVRWEAGSDRGTDLADDRDGVPRLLAVVTAPQVFDAVLGRLGTLRDRVACPAVELVLATGGVAELRAAQADALRALAGPAAAGAVAPLRLPDTVLPAVAGRSGIPPEQAAVRDRARRALDRATAAVDGLRGPAAPLAVPVAASRVLAAADEAVTAHLDASTEFLGRLQARIDGRPAPAAGPDPVELPDPRPADDAALAAGLRAAVTESLASGSTLATAVAALRAVELDNGGAPVARARQDLLAVERVRLQDTPGARLPAPAVAALAAVALVTTAVAAGTPAIGGWGGVALALVWALLAGLLVARLPRPAPAARTDLLPVPVVAVAAGLGLAAGRPLLGPVLGGVPAAAAWVVGAVLVVVALAAVRVAWVAALDRWTSGVPLAALAELDGRVVAAVDAAAGGPYQQALARRRLSEAAALLAVGLTDVEGMFRPWADRLAGPLAGADRSFRSSRVFRADLAAVAVAAIEPCLDDVAAGAPLAVRRDAVRSRVADLVRTYDAHVDGGSLHVPPPVGADPALRARLTAAVWERPADVERLLTGDERIPMTQLCARRDLRALDPHWPGIQVLRFAPGSAPGGLADGVLATTADAAGLLRLVPMRAGTVSYAQPASGMPAEESA